MKNEARGPMFDFNNSFHQILVLMLMDYTYGPPWPTKYTAIYVTFEDQN